jgi:hypothetical protein
MDGDVTPGEIEAVTLAAVIDDKTHQRTQSVWRVRSIWGGTLGAPNKNCRASSSRKINSQEPRL